MADISTAPTNARVVATQDNTVGNSGLDQPTVSTTVTQATTDQQGREVGIPLPDETGTVGNIRRNPETGELYTSTLRLNPETGGYYDTAPAVAPTSGGAGDNDDAAVTDDGLAQANDAAYTPEIYGFGYGDDAGTPASTTNTESTPGALNSNTRPLIKPRPNVLDQFSSYTYRISVYLMTPQQYNRLARSRKKNISGYNLLFQSGGAPVNVGGFQGALGSGDQLEAGGTDAGRNPAFPLDFYIDSCSIVNLLQGKGTGAAHAAAEIKFTVVEPMGITLIDRIYEAVQDSMPLNSAGKINYTSAQFLMVIRWYGYDAQGALITGDPNNSDPRAAVEKMIPFVIQKIDWKVGAKSTEYEFSCVPVGQIIAGGTRRGLVPYDIQLSQGSVGAVLSGPELFVSPTQGNDSVRAAPSTNQTGANNQTATAPTNANAAANAKKTVKQGLMSAMNQFCTSLTQGANPIYKIADQYEIVFAKGAEAIRDASIVLPGKKKESKLTPMIPPASVDPQSANQSTHGKDITVATRTIYAGQPVVQVIDQIIRSSSYITQQALYNYELPDGGQRESVNSQDSDETSEDNARRNQKSVNWYRINFEATPIGENPDILRNDYAYKIRYIISAYKIDNYESKYFPVSSFRGVHKSYGWLFTGKNTAILDYSETLNSAFHMLVSGSSATNSAAETERRKIASTLREMITYTYGPRSAESSQGSETKNNELGASLADSLYGGADLGKTTVSIIGDPAWIQQGSLSSGIESELDFDRSFLPDGTINFDAEQINFEVYWKRPADYDLTTGLADPNTVNRPSISRVYTASKVTSFFRQGQFTQSIEGLLMLLPKTDGSNRAPGAAAPRTSAADNNREPAAAAATAETAANRGSPVGVTSQGTAAMIGAPQLQQAITDSAGRLAAPVQQGINTVVRNLPAVPSITSDGVAVAVNRIQQAAQLPVTNTPVTAWEP